MTALQTLQPLIDTVQGCLVLSSPDDGRIVSANQLASILLACPHDELLDRSMYDFLPHPADADAIRQDLDAHSMIYNRGMQLRTVNGRHFDVQLSVRKVSLNDAAMLVFSFSDRTEAKVMSQLLDYERQLVQRSLNIVKTLKEEGSQSQDEDRLTGVAGMHRMMAAAHAETSRVLRYGGTLSILALVLVNAPDMVPREDDGSAYNHLLRLAASLCLQSIRDSDLVARRDDNTLIVLLPSTDMNGASELARRLITSLRQLTFLYQGEEHQAAACVGLSELRPDEAGPKPMLERLEYALQKAQEGGANYIIRLP